MFQAMDIDFKRVEVSITSIPGKEVGRNDPCPCGSGKKYKKCCLNKQTILNSPSIKDYGMAHLSDTFFEANPFEEISAARITYSCILNSGIEQTAARKAMSSVPRERWKKEAEKIKKETKLEGLLKIMAEFPDPFNHPLLKKKILGYSSIAISTIIETLRNNQNDVFVELGIKIIYESKIDCSFELLRMLDSIKDTYTLSTVCLLLGFIGHKEAIQPVWNYYHFFRNAYPEETYEQGPLLALYEFRARFGLHENNKHNDN
ncbi:MAG: hypothetical protein A2551_08220 [Elusimicrobia bacterium RIFOXYD2_FULL_34_30]|nr:MAG: hypothetical protein A2551_08220 [Elusimicrobia bacterium RIFOXYD2_FULL_34_30]